MKTIEPSAFEDCKKLREVKINGMSTVIGGTSFKRVGKKLTIIAKENSSAYRYAKKKGYKVRIL